MRDTSDVCDFCQEADVDWTNAPLMVDGVMRFLCWACASGVEIERAAAMKRHPSSREGSTE